MKITTATGRELECDYATIDQDPVRLYTHLPNLSLMETMAIFINPAELPLKEYPAFDVISSIYSAAEGTNMTLKNSKK